MIEIEVTNLEDFKRIVKSQKKVYGKKIIRGLIYVASKYIGMSMDTVVPSACLPESCENPNLSESKKIQGGSLAKIERISPYRRVLHGQEST